MFSGARHGEECSGGMDGHHISGGARYSGAGNAHFFFIRSSVAQLHYSAAQSLMLMG